MDGEPGINASPNDKGDDLDESFCDNVAPSTKGSILVNVSRSMARNSWKFLLGSLISATVLSVIGIIVGDFTIVVENEGWRSRKTLIANREIQSNLILINQEVLFNDDDGSAWEFLARNKQDGWDFDYRRSLSLVVDNIPKTYERPDNCGWYRSFIDREFLIGAWKPVRPSALDLEVLLEICTAEQSTLDLIKSEDACEMCDGECLPPQSLVLILRNYLSSSVNGTLQMSCEDLTDLYTSSVQSSFTAMLANCIDHIKETFDSETFDPSTNVNTNDNTTTPCPDFFPYIASLVDTSFGTDNKYVQYTSSIFPTDTNKFNRLYDVVNDMDRGDKSIVRGVYGTSDEYFINTLVDEYVQTDMILATASFFITMLAMLIHTRSPWLTLIGILQIMFAIPLAYFVYRLVAQLEFFPFLNFIGVFVVAALGADDVFVAVDKWKNARNEAPKDTTEGIASVALPDAARAMFLTTSSTCVAFFATAICSVAPIRCFAVFVGLLVIFDYVMCIALIFPALCLYDKWIVNNNANCLVIFGNGRKEGTDGEFESANKSLIHRILSSYYKYLHKFRWLVLVIFTISLGVCIYFASTLQLPESSDVRLLPEEHQLELNYAWQKELLLSQYTAGSGSRARIIWGVKPADNGNSNVPDSLSSLVIDNSFDAQSKESQIYLRDMCDKLFENEFALRPNKEYECPINSFDLWLQEQATLSSPTEEYETYCSNASLLPMISSSFEACFIAWSKITGETFVLQKNGKIQVLIIETTTSASYLSSYSALKREWKKFENWLSDERSVAPEGVNRMYHTSGIFWFYDTNRAMLETALGAAGIAIGFSTLVVFIASRSFYLTLFSTLAIVYVLAATVACLVGFGWYLGFLESVCLAILIGISCDFVIHFSHAYNHLKGDRSSEERTKYTVIHMGPSILAAAATTFSAALVMLFCKVTFFTKFALILFMTMLHSTIGTFVGFLVLADIFGPSNPTKFVDNQFKKFTKFVDNQFKKFSRRNMVESK